MLPTLECVRPHHRFGMAARAIHMTRTGRALAHEVDIRRLSGRTERLAYGRRASPRMCREIQRRDASDVR